MVNLFSGINHLMDIIQEQVCSLRSSLAKLSLCMETFEIRSDELELFLTNDQNIRYNIKTNITCTIAYSIHQYIKLQINIVNINM